MQDKTHTELYIGAKSIKEQLKWDGFCSMNIDVNETDTRILVFMCEFDAEHPSWPGAIVCGQKTLIGRFLAIGERNVRFGNRTARVQYSSPELTVGQLYRSLDVKWVGAKKSGRKRQEEMDASVAEAKESGKYDIVMVSSAEPKCASCGMTGPGAASLKACSVCMLVRYCSKECQKADWKKHKPQCNAP